MGIVHLLRIFLNQKLSSSEEIKLNKYHSHYLINVMRKKINDQILIFNNQDGEWLATIKSSSSKTTELKVERLTRKPEPTGKLWLVFSPIKNHRLQFMIEKSVELGVAGFIPILTKHSVVNKINHAKLSSWIIEASEQSRRISIPIVEEMTSLSILLSKYNNNILLCDETEKNQHIGTILENKNFINDIAILIGPEGGFSSEERELFDKYQNINRVSLGKRILRTETAAISAISAFQTFYNFNF